MIELERIIESARVYEASPHPLEIQNISAPDISKTGAHAYIAAPNELKGTFALTAYYFRKLLRLHTQEQREAANLFIKAMHDAHPNTVAINRILQSEKIKPHKPITAKQALRAYQKFELLEETSYQFVDDGSGKNHKKLKFMHGLVLKLKTFFS